MPELKKITLDSKTQEALWAVLHNENEVIVDVFGAEIKLTVLSPSSIDQQEIIYEIDSNPELMKMLLDSEEDEIVGRVYTAKEAIHFIREFHSK